jgi:hypothetical protein
MQVLEGLGMLKSVTHAAEASNDAAAAVRAFMSKFVDLDITGADVAGPSAALAPQAPVPPAVAAPAGPAPVSDVMPRADFMEVVARLWEEISDMKSLLHQQVTTLMTQPPPFTALGPPAPVPPAVAAVAGPGPVSDVVTRAEFDQAVAALTARITYLEKEVEKGVGKEVGA